MAAIKIQSAYRGHRVRKQFHIFLRNLFDETDQTLSIILLQTQISRLAFFFRPAVDCERTVSSLILVISVFNTLLVVIYFYLGQYWSLIF